MVTMFTLYGLWRSRVKKRVLIIGLIMGTMGFFQKAMAGDDYIEVYSAFTNGKRVFVEGRVVDVKDKKTKESNVFSAFINDERKNVEVTLSVGENVYVDKSDSEGYFLFDVETKSVLKQMQTVTLQTKDEKSLQELLLYYPSSKKHIGVISDFDDTVVVSDVTKKVKLLYNTFFKSYKKREIIPEVEKQIKEVLKENNSTEQSALFIISGSPYQLTYAINNFLDFHNFPKRAVLTKKVHGEKKDFLLASVAYKYDKIVRLIEMYPQINWVLFGDSGEKDKEIYLKVKKQYSSRIGTIYIRDVESKKVEAL